MYGLWVTSEHEILMHTLSQIIYRAILYTMFRNDMFCEMIEIIIQIIPDYQNYEILTYKFEDVTLLLISFAFICMSK